MTLHDILDLRISEAWALIRPVFWTVTITAVALTGLGLLALWSYDLL
jgi:hypothetical protein